MDTQKIEKINKYPGVEELMELFEEMSQEVAYILHNEPANSLRMWEFYEYLEKNYGFFSEVRLLYLDRPWVQEWFHMLCFLLCEYRVKYNDFGYLEGQLAILMRPVDNILANL